MGEWYLGLAEIRLYRDFVLETVHKPNKGDYQLLQILGYFLRGGAREV